MTPMIISLAIAVIVIILFFQTPYIGLGIFARMGNALKNINNGIDGVETLLPGLMGMGALS